MSHVDDFTMAGTKVFLKEMTGKIAETLNILKIKECNFQFTGVDVRREKDAIMLSIEAYEDSVKDIGDVRY